MSESFIHEWRVAAAGGCGGGAAAACWLVRVLLDDDECRYEGVGVIVVVLVGEGWMREEKLMNWLDVCVLLGEKESSIRVEVVESIEYLSVWDIANFAFVISTGSGSLFERVTFDLIFLASTFKLPTRLHAA
jgi:hypothetical protein